MSRLQLLATPLSLLLLALPLVIAAALAADLEVTVEDSKCVTTPASNQCSSAGDIMCGAQDKCQGSCYLCNSTNTLPAKMCVTYEGKNCVSQPTKDPICGDTAKRYKGTCKKVSGSNNCTCEDRVVQGNCGVVQDATWPCK